MRWSLQRGKPSAGDVTQAFASVHSTVVKHHKINKGIEEALCKAQVTSQGTWVKQFGVSDVVMLQELCRRAPVAARKVIVSGHPQRLCG